MASEETLTPQTHEPLQDETVAPQLAELGLADKPDGPAAAAMVAAGIGIFTLGLLTTLAAAFGGVADLLATFDFIDGVGPLAGKSTLAVIVWAAAWAILAVIWRGKDTDLRRMFAIGLVLGLLGAVGTFPTFFEAFHA